MAIPESMINKILVEYYETDDNGPNVFRGFGTELANECRKDMRAALEAAGVGELLEALEPFAKAAADMDASIENHKRLGIGNLSDNAKSGFSKFCDYHKAREVYRKFAGEKT